MTAEQDTAAIQHEMQQALERLRKAQLRDGPPSAEVRIDRMDRGMAMIMKYKQEICTAVSADFGYRSQDQTMMLDILGSIGAFNHAKQHLEEWMKPQERQVNPPLDQTDARAWIQYQPLGVVGVISPWNFPGILTFSPMAEIFAAGNRVMIKPSEYTPQTSELMATMVREFFDEEEAAVFTGGPAVGEAFSRLAFDHLLFTGATSIARHVMRAAAENLVPVTLELGGKSPVVIGKSADIARAAAKVMPKKMMNAGQICLAPDYVMVPEGTVDAFIEAAADSVRKMYPTLKDNPDYTSVINQRHYERLQGYIQDARDKGARIVEINPADEDFSQQQAYKIPPTIIVEPTDDMACMKEEIFGPLLPVKSYKEIDDAIGFINDRDRPLALYYFGNDESEQTHVLERTTSGGVTVNDVMGHVMQDDLPFGGVGASGMGRYHGFEGFQTFSHAKAIFSQTLKMDMTLFDPPYGDEMRGFIDDVLSGGAGS